MIQDKEADLDINNKLFINDYSKNNFELLAPSGSFLSLILAIQQNANAIYLGYSKYSARSFAVNFNKKELKYAIDYAHCFNVKVYLTLNTLIYNSEIKEIIQIAKYSYEEGIDGIIVQDIGLLSILKEYIPNLILHGSTQITCNSLNHLKFLKELNIKRVVLSRENSLSEIKFMKNNIDIELEIFIHGSLCISYSGQCLFSYFLGGRSGNRGECAQPCRKKYNILFNNKYFCYESSKYILSPKDLNLSFIINKILPIKIDSFKIEGRMKRPEYVSGVVNAYYNIITQYLKKIPFSNFKKIYSIYYELLFQLYNRKFTTGYIKKNSYSIINSDIPFNQGKIIGTIISTNYEKNTIKILLNDIINNNDGITIENRNKNNNHDRKIGFKIQKIFKNNKLIPIAKSGDIVDLLIPQELRNKKYLFYRKSYVYKTFNYNLYKHLLNNIINKSNENLKNDIESSNDIIDFINKLGSKIKKINISLSVSICKYRKIKLTLHIIDENKKITIYSDYIVEKSINNPISKQNIYDSLFKSTDIFIYNILSIEILLEDFCFVPIKILKDLRNKLLDMYLLKKILSFKKFISNNKSSLKYNNSKKLTLNIN